MEGVPIAAILVVLRNLIAVLKKEYYLIRDLDKEAKQLQTTLGMIQSYLNDAEKKSITIDAVKLWLTDLEASAFDADNILDELSYHLLRKKVMAPKKNKVLSFFSSFNHMARPRNIALKIKQVNADFESKYKMATVLSLQNIVMNPPPTYALPASFETDSLTLDRIFIGRDDVVSEIVDKLSQISGEEMMISILAIVGMGGMGKTTLTRKVFNHEKIKTPFGSLIWVHVSQIFDPIDLFKKILSALTSQTSDGVENREVILKNLQEALKSKTYLLVLDDIWNEDLLKWEDFINSILGATSTMGNGIIMSTRKENVASLVRPLHIHPLKVLSDEDCWSIIKAKSFENRQVPSSGFEMIGRKIAERCGGLPLAANVVGGALLRCKSEQQWRFISENWLSDDEGGKNISTILKLSFDYLPSPSLKKCFAYSSIFPKGWNIKKQELIEQWMAEGFLLQADEKKEEMESVGEKFIDVLLHNSLLQVSEVDKYGNVETCVMHDLVHDLASSCFNQDRYIYMLFGTDTDWIYDPNSIAKEFAKCVRTLLLRSKLSDSMFSDFESLRVLVLFSYFDKKLPNSIRNLTHLRSLSISRTGITELPEWIGELLHLQILRAETEYLRKLPGTFTYLINLRHLYISSQVELPANIGRLTSLRTLTHFNVGDEKGYGIEELGSLKNLKGKLEIRNLEKVHGMEEALKANIYHKPNLLELRFKWDGHRECETNDDESVLEGLQPHADLKKLEIHGYKGKRFPSWTQKMEVRHGPQGNWVPLTNLIEIKLSECSECEEIPMLGHLPNLKFLYLIGLKNVRIINSLFNKLTKLQLERLDGLECLPDRLFYNNPNLSELEIKSCPKLRELPDGLHALISLEELTIYDCPNLKSLELGSLKKVRSINSSFNKLTKLQLEALEGLECLPGWLFYNNLNLLELKIYSCPRLRELPDGLYALTCLEKLTIYNCPNLKALELGGLRKVRFINSSFNKLTKLVVERLEGLECLPDWLFHNNPNLSKLEIRECPKLRELPDGLHALASLEWLTIYNCPNLKSIIWNNNIPGGGSRGGGGVYNCPNLKSIVWNNNIPGGGSRGGGGGGGGLLRRLYIDGCGELVELPRQMMESWAPSLVDLKLKELSSLQNLPMLIGCLAKSAARLTTLTIEGVPKFMASSSSGVESWSCGSLRKIEIDVSMEWSRESSGSIEEIVEGMLQGCCNSLGELKLKGMIDWDWLPGSIQYLVSVKGLELESFGIQELPEWFGNLSSLRYLTLNSCNKLRRLLPYKALSKLKVLYIKDCPELEFDSEWRNIPRLTIISTVVVISE